MEFLNIILFLFIIVLFFVCFKVIRTVNKTDSSYQSILKILVGLIYLFMIGSIIKIIISVFNTSDLSIIDIVYFTVTLLFTYLFLKESNKLVKNTENDKLLDQENVSCLKNISLILGYYVLVSLSINVLDFLIEHFAYHANYIAFSLDLDLIFVMFLSILFSIVANLINKAIIKNNGINENNEENNKKENE